ncbi:MAG: hypothetical protein SFU91_07685 [Chloroherpetonaceae bacterium]|nr:hypothetical protein [Chloroherpetonaceae bacterium]
MREKNLIFIFVDGLGLGSASETNPLSVFPMKRLKALTGTEFVTPLAKSTLHDFLLLPIDAGLDVAGAGQSGTGQFSIYTGINGAERFGRHFGPHLPSSLKPLLSEFNPFTCLNELGLKTIYLNAYPNIFIETCLKLRQIGKIRSSVLFEAAALAGQAFFSVPELKAGRAVSGDITGAWWKKNLEHGNPEIEEISPEEAARNAMNCAKDGTAVFFEFFLPDLAGHARVKLPSSEIIRRLEGFLCEIISQIDPRHTLLVLTSDHGNFEDLSTEQHTLNPVPLLVYGNESDSFRSVHAIHQLFPKVMQWLSEK